MTALRVLHVDTGRTWRGGQAQVDLLLSGLAARGARQGLAAPEGPLARRAAQRGIEGFRFAPRGDLDAAAALALAVRARAFRPDVVHLHDARAHALGWLAAVATGAACVVSRRVAFGSLARPPHAFKYRRLPVDRFLALSTPVRAELLALGVPERRIDLVPDAVDVAGVERAVAAARTGGAAAARRALAGEGEGPVVGTIAAFTREKGQDLLLEAVARASTRPRVLLHGEGPEEEGLRDRAATLGIGARLGFVHGEDPFVTLAALDVLVIPSRAEGLGSIALAAQAAGVPVVAAAVGGLPDIIDPERSGLLVPAGDPAARAGAIDRTLGEPGATRDRARAGREAVVAFDVPGIVERTLRAYEAARLNRGPGPR